MIARRSLLAGLMLLTASGLPNQSAADEYKRIVSLGGSITEILYELDLHERIAAVDVTSVYPPEALKDKPNVGYVRALNAEGVLGANPDIILAEHDAGPPEVVDILKAASVPFVKLEAAYSGDGILSKIRAVGEATGHTGAAQKLIDRVDAQLRTVETVIAELPEDKKLKVLFILTIQNGRLMIAGRKNQADSVIKMAGGINLMQAIEGYKVVDNEALLSNPPDAIVMMTRSGHTLGDEVLAEHPALKNSPAVQNKRIIRMPGMYLLGFGPRTAYSVSDLARRLYPDMSEFESLPKTKANGQ